MVHEKTFTQNLECSQRQIHIVHMCKFSQAKTTKRHLYQQSTNSPYPPTPPHPTPLRKVQLYIVVKCRNIYRVKMVINKKQC